MSKATEILAAAKSGNPRAADELLVLVYDELRRLAAVKIADESTGQTLTPTGLVHEAYLRLVGQDGGRRFNDQAHFFAAASLAMRRILIDNASRKRAQKRGNGWQRQSLENCSSPEPDDELVALDEALEKLAECDPQKAKLVELRYFGGLNANEAAAVLGISPSTADRHWAYARAWLQAEVRGS